MKYKLPVTSDKWILNHAKEIKDFFKFCHCTGEDCAADCPYVSIGADDYHCYPSEWNRKECTKILLKHYKRLMYLEGTPRKQINKEEKHVKEIIRRCIDYYGYNSSGIRP